MKISQQPTKNTETQQAIHSKTQRSKPVKTYATHEKKNIHSEKNTQKFEPTPKLPKKTAFKTDGNQHKQPFEHNEVQPQTAQKLFTSTT